MTTKEMQTMAVETESSLSLVPRQFVLSHEHCFLMSSTKVADSHASERLLTECGISGCSSERRSGRI